MITRTSPAAAADCTEDLRHLPVRSAHALRLAPGTPRHAPGTPCHARGTPRHAPGRPRRVSGTPDFACAAPDFARGDTGPRIRSVAPPLPRFRPRDISRQARRITSVRGG